MADALQCDLTGLHEKFFDRWLRGRTDALEGTAPVRIFVMGIDQWRDEQDWPLPDTTYVEYHLVSGGRANSAEGDGVLSTDPAAEHRVDTFLYDPLRPVPTLGGRVMLPPDTGSGSKSPAATSRASTATRTPGALSPKTAKATRRPR